MLPATPGATNGRMAEQKIVGYWPTLGWTRGKSSHGKTFKGHRNMPSDAARQVLRDRLTLSLYTPDVRLTDCDGRYRAYQNCETGLWYLAAFTVQGKNVTRSFYGPVFKDQQCPVFYADELDAECAAAKLNVRIG
jgi:hypothetical protein